MFFTMEKFQKRVEELGARRYYSRQCIAPFTAMPGDLSQDDIYHEVPAEVHGDAFDIHDMFEGRDRYLWLEKEVIIPKAEEGFETAGLFKFREAGGDNNKFEALLYLDGHPYQGLDANHNEALFGEKEGEKVRMTLLLWTGLEDGGVRHELYHQLQQADFTYVHKKTDEFYYFAKAITETLKLLPKENENYENLKIALDRALCCIDWDSDCFYESMESAHACLMAELDKLEKHTDVTVYGVGHTHIDIAWLWRIKHAREKAQRSFSTVLRLMDRYDDYVFLQSQPQLYQYIKKDCPELYAKIKGKVADGKWEPDGGMWVEADCNLTSGESLVRQFLRGTRFFEREFGKKCEYLWLPDVFGYSWSLPQILKQCEMNTFMTTKISWSQYNTLPDDLFYWKGIDGTDILTYFITTPDEGQDLNTRYSTYSGMMSPHTVFGAWKKFKNKELSKDVLTAYGYGDGGGGVTRDMLETRRAMDKIPGLPNVKTGTAREFFKKVHEHVENTDQYVHTWDGELYLEYHRGTYTSQAYNKKMNRYLENKLIQTEWLSSLAYVLGNSYEQSKINESWETLLLNQFHDIIPGSSIHEVYEDSDISYKETDEQVQDVKDGALQSLVKDEENHFAIYSSNSFGGKELLTLPGSEDGCFYDEDGTMLESYKTTEGHDVLVDVKPFAVKNLIFTPGEEAHTESAFQITDNTIETPFYSIVWNAEGQLTRIYDKEAKREALREGQNGNVLEMYEDKPMNFDAWDIDIYHTQKMETMKICKPAEVVEADGLKAVIRFTYQYRKSTVVQDMIVYRDLRRIDFKTHVEWNEDHRLLKTAFYTDIRSTKATYDIQYGHVERPTHWNHSWDWARFEVCGHKWADLSETGYGVSLMNDCKYGYSVKENVMRLSLLKSAKYPDTEADMGAHDFTYSLYPHTGSVTEGGTIEAANQLNLPAQILSGTFTDTRSLVTLSGNGVQIDAIKKAEDEDCLIVRMHECRGGRQTVTVSSELPVQKFVPCNLLEHNCGEELEGNTIDLTFRPFEIKTYKLYI